MITLQSQHLANLNNREMLEALITDATARPMPLPLSVLRNYDTSDIDDEPWLPGKVMFGSDQQVTDWVVANPGTAVRFIQQCEANHFIWISSHVRTHLVNGEDGSIEGLMQLMSMYALAVELAANKDLVASY